jgi:2,4-dienoyl-CoA reductase-like NADH-dependent reductase (Old Yellow Enzyme family)
MPHDIFSTFTLPNGNQLKNRLVKAAMEENLANQYQLPDTALMQLYSSWALGGVGLIITGNVMVDHLAMTGPGGLVLEKNTDLVPFIQLAKRAQQNNCKVWMQINHPGRQVYKRMGGKVLSPSNIALNMGKHSALFTQPKAMNEIEIQEVITRFVTSAKKAQEAGFNGVEVHAAHGYLLAQFLSPLTNKRQDSWGGSLENRARLLLNIVEQIRVACGRAFDLAVKLNSADFQRGGFDIDDAQQVVYWLAERNVDMVELSGGSYEAPAMQGRTADNRTLAREAYFLEFASKIADSSQVPIMTTGGISRLLIAEQVIENGVALVGMASALAYSPDLPLQWLEHPERIGFIPSVNWQDKTLSAIAVMALIKKQLRRMSRGQKPKSDSWAWWALVVDQIRLARLTKRYRKQFKSEIVD